MTSRCRRYVALLVLSGILAACVAPGADINDDPNAGTVQQQYDRLLQRPNIERATHTYQRALKEIKQALSDKFDLPKWEQRDDTPIGAAACGFDFPDVHLPSGITKTISGGFSRTALPDDRWIEAVSVVTKIAGKYGFHRPQGLANDQKAFSVHFVDDADSHLSYGQIENMSLYISTGCHLTPEAHERGGPPPEESR